MRLVKLAEESLLSVNSLACRPAKPQHRDQSQFQFQTQTSQFQTQTNPTKSIIFSTTGNNITVMLDKNIWKRNYSEVGGHAHRPLTIHFPGSWQKSTSPPNDTFPRLLAEEHIAP